ncbi:amidohydrolase family protein [Dactylosporangium sp. CA-092794]|uniref:amidohydrolase family protein n=1 Tax=Dactylosporangium sp. CA-092794 TaxID=3239929 RepID=UPI003D941B83
MDTLVLRAATVVGTRTGTLTPAVDLVIHNGRIGAVGGDAPAGAVTVDATGLFVVPGFVDMHAHPLQLGDPAGALELMLAHGITGFRQMAGSAALLRDRSALRLPEAAPRLLAMPGDVLTPVNAATPEAAVATVAAQHAAGADFVKLAALPAAALEPVLAEGRRLGIPVAGHLPSGADVVAAARGGMRSIEHLGPGTGMLCACSGDAAVRAAQGGGPRLRLPPPRMPFLDQVMRRITERIVINPLVLARESSVELYRRAIDTFDADQARGLAGRFAAEGTWHCPTLIRQRTTHLADHAEFRADANLRYVHPRAVKRWRASADTFGRRPEAQRSAFAAVYATHRILTKLFDEAGVRLLAGSDACGAIWNIAGAALHQEFDELSAAGLSPLRVLQTATLNAAEFLGTTATMGTVEPGRDADLVLLRADPLADSRHLHAIAGVVRAGRYYDAAALAAIRDRVAANRTVR